MLGPIRLWRICSVFSLSSNESATSDRTERRASYTSLVSCSPPPTVLAVSSPPRPARRPRSLCLPTRSRYDWKVRRVSVHSPSGDVSYSELIGDPPSSSPLVERLKGSPRSLAGCLGLRSSTESFTPLEDSDHSQPVSPRRITVISDDELQRASEMFAAAVRRDSRKGSSVKNRRTSLQGSSTQVSDEFLDASDKTPPGWRIGRKGLIRGGSLHARTLSGHHLADPWTSPEPSPTKDRPFSCSNSIKALARSGSSNSSQKSNGSVQWRTPLSSSSEYFDALPSPDSLL